MTKRIFDILAAIFGLVVCSPLFVLIALLIKLDSPGPVLFKQVRMGKGFRKFYVYKFRTMVRNASQKGGALTVGEDPRVTRVGRVLRKYKLDELPQLLNVLRGEMSLVGPRPEVPHYVEMCREGYEDVLRVRPGLTDLASLKYIDESTIIGKASNPEDAYVKKILPQKIQLAIVYIEHASFAFDIAIITQTLFRLIGLRAILFKLPGEKDSVEEVDIQYPAALRQYILKYRRPIIIGLDLALIVLSNYLAFWLRFDGSVPDDAIRLFFQMLPWLVLIRGITFTLFRLNEGLWRYVSIWDLKNIVSGVLTSTILFYVLVLWGAGLTAYPRSIYIIDSMSLIGLLVGIRLSVRLFREYRVLRRKKRVLIVGAGDAGEKVVREMKTHPSCSYDPIGFVDDEPSLIGKRIHGIKVLGTRKGLSRIFLTNRPQEVLVALPGTNPATLREIITSLESFRVPIKTLPNLRDLLDGKVTIEQIRNLAIEDLLPRPPVGSKPQSLRHLIAGKRVFITGAGGSIGSELCRQVAELHPKSMMLYERYENSLYTITNQLADRGANGVVHPVIGDVTDAPRLRATIKEHRPDIIFHAAAHKHVPLMELNPGEALKNNVLGTRLVAETAEQFGVERFVLISTDKAVNPSSVMGATKRLAEVVVQELAKQGQTRYLTVRFGNVLGSNGSVVPRFQEQIKTGGPVTVTHPEVRRYFMLISEAVHLVLQAAALGEQSAIYVLEMGEQIKLVDLARNLIRLSGFVPEKEIPISFVGLRPGEKIEEELVGDGEIAEPSSVEKIFKIRSGALPDISLLTQKVLDLEHSDTRWNSSSVIEQLKQLVPTYQQPMVTKLSEISAKTKQLDGVAPQH